MEPDIVPSSICPKMEENVQSLPWRRHFSGELGWQQLPKNAFTILTVSRLHIILKKKNPKTHKCRKVSSNKKGQIPCFWCGDIINMEICEFLCQLPLKMANVLLFIIIVPLFQPLNPHSGLFCLFSYLWWPRQHPGDKWPPG